MENVDGPIRAALEDLKKLRIDTPVFSHSVSNLWSIIYAVCHAYLDSLNSSFEGLEIDGSELENVILLAIKTFSQVCSKAELVECTLKRQKAFEDILQLENQILSWNDASFALLPKSRIGIVASNLVQGDLASTTNILLNLKYYAEKFDTEAFEDHVNSINAMLELITSQRSFPQLTIPVWNRSELDVMSQKDLTEIFPERLAPLPIDDHTIAEKALSRSYGSTIRCLWDGQFVAVKKINRRVFQNNEANLRDALLMLEMLAKPPLQSPYLAKTIGFSWEADGSAFYFVQQLAPERSLYDSYTNHRLLPQHRLQLKPSDKVSIILDVVKAVEHLHKHGIVHGRIKDTNILLYPDFRVKLSDVGLNPFLTNNTRLTLKGTHGLRWTPPEVMKQEVEWNAWEEEYQRMTSVEIPTVATLASLTRAATLLPSVDIYGIGVLAVVLLTESLPFYNIPWDEGVKNTLLEGNIPPMKSRYPDKQKLGCLENDVICACLEKPIFRPAAETLVPYLEELYCTVLRHETEATLKEHRTNVEKVQSELDDIKKKIQEHEVLLSKGKELIRRKEDEKLRARELKVKREKDLEIEKARQKMLSFKAELEGLQEDKDGAEADLEALHDLVKEAESELAEDIRAPLEGRDQGFIDLEQEVVLDIYCDEVEYDRLDPRLLNRGLLTFPPPTAWPTEMIDRSPFATLYQRSIPDLTSKEIDLLHAAVTSKTFRYLPLVGDLDLIFRVPFTAKKSKPIDLHLQYSPTPVNIANRPAARTLTHQTSQSHVHANASHGDHDVRLISTASEDSTYRPRPKGGKRDVAIDSDDEVPDDGFDMRATSKRAASRIQQPRKHSRDLATISRDRISSSVRASTANHLQGNLTVKLVDREAYEVQITQPLVLEDDGFPDNDFDIIHVQYLAAVCGSWNDAVGLRRLKQGFPDDYIAGFLDNGFTPVHMAAFLGNYDILVELVTLGNLSAVALDVSGDTALHVACKRGHAKVVRYLCQTHGLSPTMLNSQHVTPLQFALKGGFLDIVMYFMEECNSLIRPDFIDGEYGASLLHWAALSMNTELMDYLINHQHMNVEELATADGSTPFLWACYNSSKEGVQHLVEKASALVSATDQTGMTGLHYATMSGYVDKVTYLMDFVRLKVTDKDENHQTPYDVAVGPAALFLKARKEKGFVTGSIVERSKEE